MANAWSSTDQRATKLLVKKTKQEKSPTYYFEHEACFQAVKAVYHIRGIDGLQPQA